VGSIPRARPFMAASNTAVGCIFKASNTNYLRMRALISLATSSEYRQEVLSNNLCDYIVTRKSVASRNTVLTLTRW
jgi:hypothetical protein